MCLLAIFFRVVEDAPVVVGANREEFFARGGEPPKILAGPCQILAGVDPKAGGTWLGVNAHGLIGAVTNRSKTAIPPRPRSRGMLLRELLGCPDTRSAVTLATRELSGQRYAGCNILLADQNGAQVIHAGDWLRVRPLPPGIHVLTANDVNDGSDRRIGHAMWWLGQRDYTSSEQCLVALRELCSQVGNGDPPICLRGTESGTVSSTLVALQPTLERSRFLHAQGPPDRTPYEDYSHLLGKLHV